VNKVCYALLAFRLIAYTENIRLNYIKTSTRKKTRKRREPGVECNRNMVRHQMLQ